MRGPWYDSLTRAKFGLAFGKKASEVTKEEITKSDLGLKGWAEVAMSFASATSQACLPIETWIDTCVKPKSKLEIFNETVP